MKLTITPTDRGVTCLVYVALISTDGNGDVSEFEAALQELPPPREAVSLATSLRFLMPGPFETLDDEDEGFDDEEGGDA